MDRVKDKVVVVTGGALGIGRATCQLLAQEGARVAVTDIVDDEGKQVVDEIKKNGGDAEYWHLDVSKEKKVEKTLKDIHDHFGKITSLVNNAGIAGANKPTHEIEEKEWDEVMNINVKGVLFCTKFAIPYLRKVGSGSIVNLSSIYGIISAPDLPPYHASKGAVRLMSKTDALHYAKDNIRVNSVHPGYIWTPLVEQLGKESDVGVEEFRKNLDSKHPIGHVGEPMDIAYAILFAVSDESKFMTGSELVIDGGYTTK